MKSNYRGILSLIWFAVLCAMNVYATVATTGKCDEGLTKVANYYARQKQSGKAYLKFSTYTVENGKEGEHLQAQLWSLGKKYHYSNKYVEVWQDEATQVIIMKDHHTILLKTVPAKADGAAPYAGMSYADQLDSLKKVASSVDCENKDKLVSIHLQLPAKVGKKSSFIKAIHVDINAQSGELKKSSYELYSNTAKQEIYEYDECKQDFDTKPFDIPAISNVMKDGHLLADFSGYALKDMRALKRK